MQFKDNKRHEPKLWVDFLVRLQITAKSNALLDFSN